MPWIGDVYVPFLTEIATSQSRPITTHNFNNAEPSVFEFDANLEAGNIDIALHEDSHPMGETLEEQRKAIYYLLEKDVDSNPFEFLDDRGHLAISSVNVPRDANTNLRQGSMTVRFLPDALYQPAAEVTHSDVSNDFGISFYDTFYLPKIASNVRLRSGDNGDSIALDPVTTFTDETGDRQNYAVPGKRGGLHPYSAQLFVGGENFDNSTGTGPSYHNDAYGLQSETLESGDTADHTFTVPDGDYTVVVRAQSSDTSHELTVEGEAQTFTASDTWETKTVTGVTASDSSLTINLSSDGTDIDVDYILLLPQNKPQITFDYPFGDELDLDATGFWKFDSGEGSTAYDSSPNGYDGTINGASWSTDTPTGEGYSLDFDGNGDVTVDAPFDFTELTLSFWFKVDTLDKSRLVNFFEGFNDGWGVYITSGSNQLAITDDTQNADATVYSGSISTGQWYHVVATIASDREQKLYLDGSLVGSGTNINELIYNFNPTLYFGQRGSDAEYFDGHLADIRLYPREFTQSEITYLYENPGEPLVGVEAYALDANQGVRVYDTNGSSDEDDWSRVYDAGHSFEGGVVLENNFTRVFLKDPSSDDRINIHSYNGSEYIKSEHVEHYHSSTRYRTTNNVSVLFLTSDKVEVQYDSGGYTNTVTLYADNPLAKFIPNENYSRFDWWLRREIDLEYGFVLPDQVTTLEDSSGNATGELGMAYTKDQNLIHMLIRSDDSGNIDINSWGAFRISNVTGDPVWLGSIPFDSTANLYSEAEDATLSSGAAVNHWEMPLDVSGNLDEFSGDTGEFTEDTANTKLTHSQDVSIDAVYLNSLIFGSSEPNDHYHWSFTASDTSSNEAFLGVIQSQNTTNRNDEYEIECKPSGSFLRIFHWDDTGSNTELASKSFTYTYGTTYHVEIERDNSSGDIDVYIWEDGNGKPGSPELSAIDTSITDGGFAGLKCNGSVNVNSFSVDAEETTSSGNSAVIIGSRDIENTTAYKQLTPGNDIPLGTYAIVTRLKQTNESHNGFEIRVDNTTDGSNIDIDEYGRDRQLTSLSETYDFYTRVVQFNDDDENDNMNVPRIENTADSNISHAVVDSYIRFPISLLSGGNQLGPQDLAFMAMADATYDRELLHRRTL